jgi:hypothetical protein
LRLVESGPAGDLRSGAAEAGRRMIEVQIVARIGIAETEAEREVIQV